MKNSLKEAFAPYLPFEKAQVALNEKLSGREDDEGGDGDRTLRRAGERHHEQVEKQYQTELYRQEQGNAAGQGFGQQQNSALESHPILMNEVQFDGAPNESVDGQTPDTLSEAQLADALDNIDPNDLHPELKIKLENAKRMEQQLAAAAAPKLER